MKRYLALLLVVLFPAPGASETLSGRVVKVVDGDTVYILDGAKTQHKIRLAGIDAPESNQPFGKKSKQHLSGMVAGQDVEIDWHKLDDYKRFVGKIIHNGKDTNLNMVRNGFAWWYRKYSNEQSPADRVLYDNAENQAKAERRGLWVDPEPMPPWEWRHQPEPPGGYASHCPCESGVFCTGKRGGRFCVRESGTRKYVTGPK